RRTLTDQPRPARRDANAAFWSGRSDVAFDVVVHAHTALADTGREIDAADSAVVAARQRSGECFEVLYNVFAVLRERPLPDASVHDAHHSTERSPPEDTSPRHHDAASRWRVDRS